MRKLLLLAFLVFPRTAVCEEPPADIVSMIEQSEQNKRAELGRLQRNLKDVMASTELAPKEKKKRVDAYRGQIRRVQKGEQFCPSGLAEQPKKGDVGVIPGRYGKVLQVIDGDEMLLEAKLGTPGMTTEVLLWVTGVKTEGLADDAMFWDADHPWECLGTKKYMTAAGSERTVYQVQPFDVQRVEQFMPLKKRKRD